MKKFLFLVLMLLFLVQLCFSATPVKYGPIEIALSASSTLPDSRVASYRPENVLDHNLETAWIEGQKGTNGASITFNFNADIIFCGFEYIPGYVRSKDSYKNNAIPHRFIITMNNNEHEILAYIKKKLTGFDPELDDKPASQPDFDDIENYSYQYVLVKPEHTQKISIRIAWAPTAKYDDAGFTELHPIYFFDNQLYCGKELAKQPMIELSRGTKEARFTPVVQIPKKDYQKEKGMSADWSNRFLKDDVKKINSSNLSAAQKAIFFPYDESFRMYTSGTGFRICSLVDYGFWECDTAHGILKRQIYLVNQAEQWLFTRVEYQDEQWTLPFLRRGAESENRLIPYLDGKALVSLQSFSAPSPPLPRRSNHRR